MKNLSLGYLELNNHWFSEVNQLDVLHTQRDDRPSNFITRTVLS